MAGEKRVEDGLARALGDDWTLFRGYRNRRGEIDHLLLGPGGLVAIEGKHRNATVHCDGDSWWFDKYDSYGNHKGEGKLNDQRGRSPSVQLNEPASELEKFLRQRGYPLAIHRVVLFTHDKSRLGSCRNPTVRVGTSPRDVIDLVNGSPLNLGAAELAQIERLITRDHKYHEGRRPPRASG
jgi:hypothetical protein